MQVKVVSFTIKVAAPVLCCLLVSEVKADINSAADFSETVKSKYFVDKTLFIQDFMSDPRLTITSAPVRSGKSTIIDMLKRFFSLPLDKNGTLIPLETTENYRLFCQPKLKICENESFVKEHMGQYPLIHINLHPVDAAFTYRTLIEQFKMVSFNTIREHSYLIDNETLWSDELEKSDFVRYVHYGEFKTLREDDVFLGFTILSNKLNLHHNRTVIVLLDEYDAFFHKELFVKPENEVKINRYLRETSKFAMKYNRIVKKGLMTGVTRMKGAGALPAGKKLNDFYWLGDHKMADYYGLTKAEVLMLIKRYTQNDKEISKIEQTINDYYNGYLIVSRNVTLYNMWSVINFFESDLKPNIYWPEFSSFTDIMDRVMKHKNVREDIKTMITKGGKVKAQVSYPLRERHVFLIRRMLKTTEETNRERFYFLLYDLGFLTTFENYTKTCKTPLVIPNLELYMEYSKLVLRYFNFNGQSELPEEYRVARLFEKHNGNNEYYSKFFRSIRYILSNHKLVTMTKDDIKTVLCLAVASEVPKGLQCTIDTPIKFTWNDSLLDKIPKSLHKMIANIVNKTKLNEAKELDVKIDIAVASLKKIAVVFGIEFMKGSRQNLVTRLKLLSKRGLCKALLMYAPYIRENPLQFFKSSMKPINTVYIGLSFDAYSSYHSMVFFDDVWDKEPTFISALGNVTIEK